MNLTVLYRASMYIVLVLATTLLSIDASEYSQFAVFYPIAVALAAGVALVTVDRNPERGLPRDLGNFLAMGTFVLSVMEYWASAEVNQARILAMGHWLVYLQLVKMFMPKSTEDDWYLLLLALVQVVVGTFLSNSDLVGVLLISWAILSMWTMGLFHLCRESQRLRPRKDVVISPAPDPKRPYPGLVNLGFVTSSLLVTVSTLLLGGLIFFLMPRWNTSRGTRGAPGAPRHLTGFSAEVKLGQMGEILEDDRLVMTVESRDLDGVSLQPDAETYFRGVTLVTYRSGRWEREDTVEARNLAQFSFSGALGTANVREHIKIEDSASDVIFSSRPFFGVSGRIRDELLFNPRDGTLLLSEGRGRGPEDSPLPARSLEYELLASSRSSPSQLNEAFPNRTRLVSMVEVPSKIAPRLRSLADSILQSQSPQSIEEVARILERYLRESGGYFYTLRQNRPVNDDDPVLDFLINRKEGHCEYFASGLALLLRSKGIPARLVNGFKGGDWNDLVRVTNVRGKHAHSWVEALVGRTPDGLPRWILLDPTPARERERIVARVGGVPAPVRTLTDAVRELWVNYIAGFDPERQERKFYGPIRAFGTWIIGGFLVVTRFFSRYFGDFFRFNRVEDVFSIKGFLVSVTLMVFALLILFGANRIWRWTSRLFTRSRSDEDSLLSEHVFYLRLQRALANAGIVRATNETPREFALRAGAFLSTVPDLADGLIEVPSKTIDAFYLMRFGQHELSPETSRWLDDRIAKLEAKVSNRPGARIR